MLRRFYNNKISNSIFFLYLSKNQKINSEILSSRFFTCDIIWIVYV